ncbi:GIY-YIG nuclease family protein [Kangiella marina]|uniref:GIY-YIG nuclease family protein n=1 Tax=Kangiella marina TaxID=1079178 RepID=A0ABP8IGF2_9GAMM
MEKEFYVYIMANHRNGALYTGVTSNLIKRVWQHKYDSTEGFTYKYQIHDLVYFEKHESSYSAIQREKRLKEWQRKWKLDLIESVNPYWNDLYETII